MLAATMHHRALALALALLLLLTQQLGAQHRASHGLVSSATSGPSATVAAWLPGQPDAGPADATCQVCLLLAALAVAALPALLRWRGLVLRGTAPLAPATGCRVAASARPYQARAPPR